jgi:GT2 family glycosyltransferase
MRGKDTRWRCPLVSVLIVNYNTRALLQRCLTSIFANKGSLAIEVFVADNNSDDGSPDMVESEFPEVSLVRNAENLGYTQAINRLLPLAKGRYHLLLHSDLELLPETLNSFMEFFEKHPRAGILGANLYYPDGTPNHCEIFFPNFKNDLLALSLRLLRRLPVGRQLVGNHSPLEWPHKSTSQVNWVWNACMIARREVFETIGFFDDNFFVWYSDWDLCKRAAEVGFTVHYVHPATAIHHERQSFDKKGVPTEDVRYKVDGWFSVAQQARDLQVFLKKHGTATSICGVKTISILENGLRLWFILLRFLARKATFVEVCFQLRACLQTIQAIMRA